MGLVVGVITYASLIVGELVPKQIALRDPEAIAVKVAPAMVLMAKFSLPLVWLLDRSGKVLLWLLGQRGEAEGKVSEDEIRTLVVEAENAGVLEPGEKEMIAGVMRLGDLPVGAVMTPRHEVSQIDLADSNAEIFAALLKTNHSRAVVFEGNRDHALGIVQAKDVLDVYLSGRTPDIRALVARRADHPRDGRCARCGRDPARFLRAYRAGARRIRHVPGRGYQRRHPGGHRRRLPHRGRPGRAGLRQTRRRLLPDLGLDAGARIRRPARHHLPSPRPYQTFAGFLLQEFGEIPDVGEKITAAGWRFEIVDLDGRRIDKALAPSRVSGRVTSGPALLITPSTRRAWREQRPRCAIGRSA